MSELDVKKIKCAQWILCGKDFMSVIHYNGHNKAYAICPYCKSTTWIYELYKKV